MDTTITTTGSGSASAAPDAVRLEAAVRHAAGSVAEALAGCASATELFEQVARRFTEEADVATRSFDLDRDYREDGPRGYVATHQLTVRCQGFDRAGELITALGDEVGERLSVHGVRPTLTDPEPLEAQARAEAFGKARAKADELAALAGQRVVGVLRVVEGADPGGLDGPVAHALSARAEATRLVPGSTSVTATLTVTWATEPVEA